MKIEKMDTEDKKLFEEMYLEYEVYLRRIAYVKDEVQELWGIGRRGI